MKKTFKKTLALMLTALFLFGSFSVSAAEYEKKHLDYGSYVLLGDSVASGWSDIEHRESTFKRVEGSFGAHIADDLGLTYHPMACIGFRTLEMRYLFEDDYEGDRFMFYSIEQEEVDQRIPGIRKAVSEAGLITLSVGGNDWGSYVGWHIVEEMEKRSGTENFVEKALPYLENVVNFGPDTIEALVDIADLAGCVPDLVTILPKALKEGFATYVENWDIMIEDIYALNPDVTLVVIGMFDTSLQDETMKDQGGISLPSVDIGINIGQVISDLANEPMREGAEKYGYIFVDPVGTLCEKQHPSYAGHRHIADLVLAALPDANFPYTDVAQGTKEYTVAQKLYVNGIMKGVSDTEFAPEADLTKEQLAQVLYNIAGTPEAEGTLTDTSSPAAIWASSKGILKADGEGSFKGENAVTRIEFASAVLRLELADGFSLGGFISGVGFLFKVLTDDIFRFAQPIDRIVAAEYIVNHIGI